MFSGLFTVFSNAILKIVCIRDWFPFIEQILPLPDYLLSVKVFDFRIRINIMKNSVEKPLLYTTWYNL